MKKSSDNRVLIGLDLGTGALKGVAVAPDGQLMAVATVPNPLLYPRPGWVEQDPAAHYQAVCALLRELTGQVQGPVAGLAMAAAAGNTLLCDGHGVPLTNIINWMDQRAVDAPPRRLQDFDAATVHRVTGWPCVTSFPLAHLSWLQEHQAELYRRTEWFCMNSDWLLFRLTGLRRIDVSTATTFHLLDQCSGQWHPPFLERLGIRPEQLSQPVESGIQVGTLTAAAARDTGLTPGIPVVSGCFDHPAAARAAGILAPGQLLLSCGTSWVGLLPDPDRERILRTDMLCDPFLSRTHGVWGGIFSVPAIGPAVDWYLEHVIAPGATAPYRQFDELAAAVPPGAHGLTIDLRQPPCPLSAAPGDVARAVMESAARLLAEKLAELRRHGFHFTRAVMVGGPSRSTVWPGIVAAATGLQLTVGDRYAGALGAALLAGIGTGLYHDETNAWHQAGIHHEY